MVRNRQLLLFALFASGFLVGCAFLGGVSASFYNSDLNVLTYLCIVPPTLAVLLISPLVRGSIKFLRRTLVAFWLALFLWTGMYDIFAGPYPISEFPWTGYLVYGLMVGVPLLVIAFTRIASLGLIKLTVCAGFVTAIVYDILNLAFAYDWFAMYVSIRVGMWNVPEATGWTDYLLVWLGFPGWLTFRLVTYLGLGYVIAKREGLTRGVLISAAVAIADATVSWLVFLPGPDQFEAPSLRVVIQYDLPELLKALLAQVAVLSTLAALGALVAQVRWPRALLQPVRLVGATGAHRRRATKVTPGATPS